MSAPPFSTPQIDTFNRVEDPISDSGQWYLPPAYNGSDRLACNAGIVTSPGFGNAIAMRLVNPGPSRDQEIYLVHPGGTLFLDVMMLLRFTPAGNGYWARFRGSFDLELTLSKSTAYGLTTLASTTIALTTFTLGCGVRAVGDEISVWYQNVFAGGPWIESLTAIDTTYASGLLGFGVSGFNDQVQSVYGGEILKQGVHSGPPLVPYGNPFAR